MSIMSKESLEPDNKEITPQIRKEIEVEYKKEIEMFDLSYEKSPLKNNCDYICSDVKPLSEGDMSGALQSWGYQFGLIAKRNLLNQYRLPNTSYIKIIVTIAQALLVILLYHDAGYDNAGIQNRKGALFFIVMTTAFSAIQNVILLFPDERPIFLREVGNNMYSVTAYFFAKITSELPMSTLSPTLYGILVYYPLGLS